MAWTWILVGGLVVVFLIGLLLGGWKILNRWWQEPVGIAVPLFACLLVLLTPQMPEMFFGMAMGYHDGKADWAWWHPLGLGVSAAWLAFQSWYWTRAALFAREKIVDADWMAASRAGPPYPFKVDPSVEWAPRVAILFSAVIAASPLLLWFQGKLSTHDLNMIQMGTFIGLLLVALLMIFAKFRSNLFTRPTPFILPRAHWIWRCQPLAIFVAAPFGWRMALAQFVLAVAAVVIVACHPHWIEVSIHAPTAALLALAFLIPFLTLILALLRYVVNAILQLLADSYNEFAKCCGCRRRITNVESYSGNLGFIMLLVLPAVWSMFSSWDHRYWVRSFDQASTPLAGSVSARPTLKDAVNDWLKGQHADVGQPVPAIVLAVAGGASRSAAWLLPVMRALDEETDGQFSRHLFAISAVSGGSLGAATYVEALVKYETLAKEGKADGGLWKQDWAEKGLVELARGDLLAPSIATFFLNDVLGRLTPIWWADDRGVALEKSFERHWEWEEGFGIDKSQAEQGFLKLWQAHHGQLPHLLFNGTDVQTGHRLITSTFGFSDDHDLFSAADDFLPLLGGDVPMSRAVTNSARFPLISPAGRFGDDAHHRQVVDGGVFENYGARTALELADRMSVLGRSDGVPIIPIVVVVSNDAEGGVVDGNVTGTVSCDVSVPPMDPQTTRTQSTNAASGTLWVPEGLAVLLGLNASRAAHGEGELVALRRNYCATKIETDAQSRFFHVALPKPDPEKDQAAPMNWVLNASACDFLMGEALEANRNQIRALRQALQVLRVKMNQSADTIGLDVHRGACKPST